MMGGSAGYINPEMVNKLDQNDLTVWEADSVYKLDAFLNNPIHFECNNGNWKCVEGE